MKRVVEDYDDNEKVVIDIAKINVLESDIESIITSLVKKQKPIELSICTSQLGDKEVEGLVDHIINTNANIFFLDLSENLITDKGAEAIAKFLKYNSSLSRLYLCNNLFHHKGFLSIFEALSSNFNLKELNLSCNYTSSLESESESEDELNQQNIKTQSAVELIPNYHEAIKNTLPKNTLVALDISFNGLDDFDGKIISRALLNNKSLTDIDLEGNSLGENTGNALIKSLEINKTLLRLNLDDSDIPETLLSIISRKIKHNNNLVTLLAKSINDNCFGTKLSNINLNNYSVLKYYQEVNKNILSCRICSFTNTKNKSQIDDIFNFFHKIDAYIQNNYFSITMVCKDISTSIGLPNEIISIITSNFGQYSLECVGEKQVIIEEYDGI